MSKVRYKMDPTQVDFFFLEMFGASPAQKAHFPQVDGTIYSTLVQRWPGPEVCAVLNQYGSIVMAVIKTAEAFLLSPSVPLSFSVFSTCFTRRKNEKPFVQLFLGLWGCAYEHWYLTAIRQSSICIYMKAH